MTALADRPPVAHGRNTLTALAVIAGTFAYFGLQTAITRAHEGAELAVTGGALAGATVLAVAFVWVRHAALPAFLPTLMRGLAAGLAFYLLVEPPVFTLARPAGADHLRLVELGYWPALAAAMLAWWRPSLLLVPAFYIPATRMLADDISGLPTSSLDIRTLCEMSGLLSLGGCLLGLAARLGRPVTPVAGLCLGFAAIAMQLGNYFWSAVAKLRLGPEPWSWTLENPTQNMLLVGLHKGALPTGRWPEVTQVLHEGLTTLAPVANSAVLLLQLGALAAAVSPRVLVWALLGYEGLHTAIYVLGGLFFWPWMWVNAAILVALGRLPRASLGLAPRLTCVAVLLSGALPELASPARLAWFDVADIRSPVIEVREPDGPWVRVPASFFLGHSYAISHGYHGLAPLAGHYPATIWGVSGSYARMRTSGTCPAPAAVDVPETDEERAYRMGVIGAFLRAHHRQMLARRDNPWSPGFYWRSHHHPANPLLFGDFGRIDLTRVSAYRLREVSLCLGLAGGRLTERIVNEDVTEFSLTPDP